MSSKNKILIKNIASLGMVQVVNYIFPLMIIPYVARIIGPEGFGIINYISAFVTYFILIINYGFDFTATRRIAVDPENIQIYSGVFSEVTCARVLLFVVSLLTFLVCTIFVPQLRDNLILSWILFINVISALLTPQYIFQGLQKLPVLSYLSLLKGAVNTSMIFLFVSKKDDLLLYAGIGVFSNFLISLISLLYVILIIRVNFKLYSIKHSINLLKEVRSVFFSSIVFSLCTTANIIILGFFEKSKTIGYYTTALGFIVIVQSVINIPLSSSLYPFIGKAFSESKESGILKLRKIAPIIFYITLPICFGILILAPFIVSIIYGKNFEGSIISIRILSFIPLISGMSGLMGVQTMLNLSMDNLFLKIISFAAVFSLLLNFVLCNYFSYVGTSISYLLTEILISVLFYIVLNNKNLSLFEKDNFKYKNIISQLKSLKNI